MSNSTAEKIYRWASYAMLAAATVAFFATGRNVQLTLLLLVVAVYLRALMYRSRSLRYAEENEELRQMARQLTNMIDRNRRNQPSAEPKTK
ncbi:MAG: hypothetical protein IJV22_04565 [Bacteroidales bacterium]|nr:hypothetical protein [Bacteroidales bacterium]